MALLGTLICAFLVIASSLVVGRAAMQALGWPRPEWLAGGVGLAILVTLAPFLVRLPGRGLTAAILLALLAIACAAATRRMPRGPADATSPLEPSRNVATNRYAREERDSVPVLPARHTHAVAVCVTLVTLALGCLPFLFNERTGVLGEGIYTNDQAAQLYWADWLADGFGPQPTAVQVGYPVGPQALAASLSEGTGVDLIDAFNGLLLAIAALTALAALSGLAALPPWRRGLAAVLVGMPFLGASFLAQSGFKETAMALFVLALALVLHLDAPGRAKAGVLVLLAAGSVFTFSAPGVAWFALAIPLWLGVELAFGGMTLDMGGVRAAARRHRWALLALAVVLAAAAAAVFGPATDFVEKIDDVQESSGRLSSPVFPGEALGIWPEGDFRIVRGEVSGSLLASGFAALCTLAAGVALLRRREWGLAATLAAAVAVYVLARRLAEIHVEAKALAVLAPVVMLVVLRWWLAPPDRERDGLGVARLAVGSLFAALALVSSFLALRAAPVGFDERGRDLEELAERIGPDDDVVFLGVDRFAGYWMRGTLMRSPGGYVPAEIGARTSKTWQQGQALDFDTLEPLKLNRQDYAITTAAAYQSTPPPNWREVAREGDYVLWERGGTGPDYEVLPDEGGDPGAPLACPAPAAGDAEVLEAPVVGEQDGWTPGFQLDAPAEASQELDVPAGDWAISLQYHSQVPLTLTVDGDAVAELPASLEGFYLVGAGRGAFWPAGELASSGGPVTISVETAEPSGLQDLLGVRRRVWLGRVALTSPEPARTIALTEACGEYVDHYLPAPAP
jgi:hypothetical protein